MTLLGLLVWTTALFVFLTAVPLLVNRDLSTTEALSGVSVYTLLSAAMVYGGWRIFAAARKIA
jgi:hypothetical protein